MMAIKIAKIMEIANLDRYLKYLICMLLMNPSRPSVNRHDNRFGKSLQSVNS